jgi:hypothetical protein
MLEFHVEIMLDTVTKTQQLLHQIVNKRANAQRLGCCSVNKRVRATAVM